MCTTYVLLHHHRLGTNGPGRVIATITLPIAVTSSLIPRPLPPSVFVGGGGGGGGGGCPAIMIPIYIGPSQSSWTMNGTDTDLRARRSMTFHAWILHQNTARYQLHTPEWDIILWLYDWDAIKLQMYANALVPILGQTLQERALKSFVRALPTCLTDITAHDQISQTFPLHICILQAIKDWRWERPGNEATDLGPPQRLCWCRFSDGFAIIFSCQEGQLHAASFSALSALPLLSVSMPTFSVSCICK